MAQSIDRTDRPATQALPAVPFPHYETFQLDNGLKVFLVQDPRPLVTMRLLVRGGSSLDLDKPGKAEMTADLLTKGTTTLDAGSFASEIDFIGGNISASAGTDNFVVAASGLRSKFDRILELFAEVVQHPRFEAGEVEKYQSRQIEGLKAARKQTGFLAETALSIVLYGRNSSLGVVPSDETIKAINPSDLHDYHSHVVLPNNSTLAVVGNFSVEELKGLLTKRLGSWKRGEMPSSQGLSTIERMSGNRIILIDRPTSVQSVIRIVSPGPLPVNSDRTRAGLLANILGGGTGLGNRLTMNLRETHGWTYSPYSYFTSNSFTGYHLAAADVNGEATDSAVVEMIAEMKRISTEPIPEKELGINVKSSVGTYVMSLARPEVTVRRVQSVDFYGMPENYYDNLVTTYNTTSSKDLQTLASKYYDRSDMVIVVIGKASEIAEPLEKIGQVELWNEDFQPTTNEDAGSLKVTLSEVWENMLNAMGGKANLQKVTSVSAHGKGEVSGMGQTFPAAFVSMSSKPNNLFIEISANIPGAGLLKLMEQYVTAKSASIYQQGQPIPMRDGQEDSLISSSKFLLEAYVNESGGTLSLKGATEVEGTRAYIVELSKPGFATITYYIDSKSWLLLRQDADGGQVFYSDWKDVEGGIKRPGSIRLVSAGGEVAIKDLVYEMNVDIPEGKFSK